MSGEQAFGCGLVGGEGGNIAADQAGLDGLDFSCPHATPMTSAMRFRRSSSTEMIRSDSSEHTAFPARR